MENQNLLDFEDNLPEQQPKSASPVADGGILTENVKNNPENVIDDTVLNSEKPKTEKQPSIDNTFEVIDQEPKTDHVEEDDVSIVSKNEENEYLNQMAGTKHEEVPTLLKTESLIDKEEDVISEIPEPTVIEPVKFVQNLENEPVSMAQTNDKISYTPEVILPVSTKKDTDEEYVCDIKIGPEELFCRIGLDKWFNPEKLPPKVEALVYWRDPVSSGIVFGATLVVLLSFAYMSLISVVAYLAMFVQTACILLRLYKTALQTVQKTTESHPFQEYLDVDIRLPQEKAEELSKVAVVHINALLVELRRLLLAEDLVDSAKFFGILWVLTYVGALFNGLTLIIIGFVALFTLPKVYENNKTQIDQNIEVVRSKIAELTNKVRAAIPIGKKTPEAKKKE